MQKPLTAAIVGLGDRGFHTYAPYAAQHPDQLRIVAVADTRPDRVQMAAAAYSLKPDQCYSSAEALLAQPKLADVLFVCTQDAQHPAHAVAALKAGYDVLLEKPIAPTLEACRLIEATAAATGGKVAVCHVLRYTPFYTKLKELLDTGAIGELVSIQHQENVGYWHQAHSFVRGNWRRAEETSFMLLAKCCHDLDLLLWLSGKRCERVSSYGGLYLFRPEKAPPGQQSAVWTAARPRTPAPTMPKRSTSPTSAPAFCTGTPAGPARCWRTIPRPRASARPSRPAPMGGASTSATTTWWITRW